MICGTINYTTLKHVATLSEDFISFLGLWGKKNIGAEKVDCPSWDSSSFSFLTFTCRSLTMKIVSIYSNYEFCSLFTRRNTFTIEGLHEVYYSDANSRNYEKLYAF